MKKKYGKYVVPKNKTTKKKAKGKSFSIGNLTSKIVPSVPSTGVVPNPDKVLKALQENGVQANEVYDDILNDDHVTSVIDVLVAGILRHPWKIRSKNKKKEKFVTEALKLVKIREVVYSLVLGMLTGMKSFEIMWKIQNGFKLPTEMIALKNSDIELDAKKGLFHKEAGIYFNDHPMKFLTYINKETENPYGVAEILKCYYPWQFKKAGWRFWLTTVEKYGVPTLVVEYDSETVDDDDEKVDELAAAFYNTESDSVIVTNNLKDLHILEAGGSAGDFKTLIDQAEQSISKVIVGTHVIMDGQSGGSRALAEIHANINFRFKVQTAIYNIAETINKLVNWIVDLNFSENDGSTEFVIEYVNIQEWEKTREAIGLGVPVSLKSIYTHVAEPEDESDIFLADQFLLNDPNNDDKSITKEGKEEDSGRKKKEDSKKTETRVGTTEKE